MVIKRFLSFFSLFYIGFYGFSYLIMPLFFFEKSNYTILLAELTFLSIIFYLIGLNIGSVNTFKKKVVVLNFMKFINRFFMLFILIVLVIVITAENVPIIALIYGADSADLVVFREDFLKAREGWESSLNYIIAIINSSFMPYLIIISFLLKHKRRFVFTGIFLVYCISFLEKAYFLKIAIPLFFLYYITVKNKFTFSLKGFSVIALILSIMFFLTSADDDDYVRNYESYFSVHYVNSGPVETMFWRAGVVPVATAVDALKLFDQKFNNDFLYGSTSSLISIIFGMPRVNFERYLYQDQFGGVKTGNANQVFLVDAFINFGITGVIVFSFIVGRIIRFCILKKNIALLSILPLFLYNLFNAGFIGVMLSEGFILFFFFVNFFKFKLNENQ